MLKAQNSRPNPRLNRTILYKNFRLRILASFTVTLSLDDGGTHTRTIRPALPSTDKQLWIKLLHLDLDAHPPPAAILAVSLHAEPGSTSKVQLGLFSLQLPEASRLDMTLAHIRAVVGEDNVGCAVLKNTHAAEACRMEPFIVPTGDSVVPPYSGPRASMRQLRPSEAASVTLRDGRPTIFIFRERRYTVEHAYGPWTVSGD